MRRRDLLRSVPGALLVTTGGDAGDEDGTTAPDRGRSVRQSDTESRHDYDRTSLRAIAASMDDEKPAELLRGNGPPFAAHRPDLYDPADLTYSTVAVGPDADGYPTPPDSLVVSGGPVKLRKLDGLVTYDGVRYLDAPSPRTGKTGPFKKSYNYTGQRADSNYTGDNRYAGDQAARREVKKAMYRYHLLFSHRNAYDLGMVNRTADNDSIPEGYTDKGIVESHRFSAGGEDHRSLRNVVDRHRQGVRHRVLWQNAKLPFNAPGETGAEQTAKLFGRAFADAGYDVVGLCEVYDDFLLEDMEESYRQRYDSTDRKYGFSTLYDLGVLLGEGHASESRVRRRLGESTSDRFEATGPVGGDSLNIEGYQHVPVHVPELSGTPAFELWVTHFQGAGSGLPGDNSGEDAKQDAKLDQLDELTTLIEAFQSGPNNHRPIVLMGDFNVHSNGSGGQFEGGSGVEQGEYYPLFMHEMRSVGMQNAWLTHGGPNAGCAPESDGYTCESFAPENRNENAYYRGSWLDYVFVERPRQRHDLHLDVSRMRSVEFRVDGETLSDHDGIGFELLTSPAD